MGGPSVRYAYFGLPRYLMWLSELEIQNYWGRGTSLIMMTNVSSAFSVRQTS